MTQNQLLTILIPAFPLLGFFIHILFRNKISHKTAGILASAWLVISFILSLVVFLQLGTAAEVNVQLFNWFSLGNTTVPFAFLVDHLSIIMMLVITGIGSLIHIYSIGYMHGDEGYNRFFAYLNLFVFFMLMLVMANNYALMFVGWEGVGLCSYLLIGFWFKNQDYNKAANKAFIMNRIGDLALLLGLFLLIQHFGSLTYHDVFNTASSWVPDTGTMTAITLLLFIGACGKSAQLPLYTWLPDAMAGPTPVSALIHAATMVTAGIYMIVRSNILFSMAHVTENVIMTIGIVTAIFAGSIALKQNDIKKVLAYSTVSQLGLMFFALGVGGYQAGFFHLVTHAFFKALLFLGAGSVIHGMGGEQDIRKMGGLRNRMKTTHWVFLFGVLAIMAVPPFSGFFSKDGILLSAFSYNPSTGAHDAHNYLLWTIGLISGLFTAFYMMRLYYLVFHGNERMDDHTKEHIHESPKVITIPLIILCALSIFGGLLNVPELFGGTSRLTNYLTTVVPVTENDRLTTGTEWMLMAVSTIAILLTILAARMKYKSGNAIPESDSEMHGFGKLLNAKYYVDEIYNAAIVKPLHAIGDFFYKILDLQVFDGIVNATGNITAYFSTQLKSIQTGNISFYLFAMAVGMAGILFLIIWM